MNSRAAGKRWLEISRCKVQRGNGRRKSLKSKKCPSEIPKDLGVPYLWDQNPRDPKRQSSKNTTWCGMPPNKTFLWKCPFCKQLTRISLTLRNSKWQFQLVWTQVHVLKWGIVGALSHVSTQEYFHASIHVASSQLGHVSLLSPFLGQPSSYPETSCLDHWSHWVAHVSLIATNLLWYARP